MTETDLGRGLFEFGLFHQQFVGRALVALDLLLFDLFNQSFLFGFQQVQLLQKNKIGLKYKTTKTGCTPCSISDLDYINQMNQRL